MAKDTEKLIRQLSLISYLMAERRPVTALEIRRDVEGYSGMNEDAFARRFYADRAELDVLGIRLTVERPLDGVAEQENYSLRPENFHLPAIEFNDAELAALQTALSLLDGEFAYAEPLRLALQQISWGRPSPLRAPEQSAVALGITASAGGHDLSQRLAKIETAIFRNKTITFDYYTMERDATGARKVDPYHLLFQGGQFYLLGHSHERDALRVFRLSRIRGKVAYATKAEHDFKRPTDFDPRAYANRADWQFGDDDRRRARSASPSASRGRSSATSAASARSASPRAGATASSSRPPYATERQLASWVLRLGEHARVEGPPELAPSSSPTASSCCTSATPSRSSSPAVAQQAAPPRNADDDTAAAPASARPAIRPERFARLVTLASILIRGRPRRRAPAIDRRLRAPADLRRRAARGHQRAQRRQLRRRLLRPVRRDRRDDGEIEVDPEPYSDNFARPARLLPVEAKALVAAIDLIGEHLPEGSLSSAREKIVAALGDDPMEQGLQVARTSGDDSAIARVASEAIVQRRLLQLDYYKANEDEFSERVVEPYALINGREGWYVAAFDPARDDVRHFRLDRIRSATVTDTDVRAAARGRPGRRRRRLAAHRRGPGVAQRARLGLARARPLGARGAPGRRGAGRRLGRSSS